MKILVKATLLSLMLASSLASAATAEDAATICQSMRNLDSRESCVAHLTSVQSAEFDQSAINGCLTLVSDIEKHACVLNLEAKLYPGQ